MINIVIIEDKAEYRNLLKMLLDYTDGFTCLAAYANAEACLDDVIYKNADVALIDIGLPKMNGVQLVGQLRRQYPALLCMMFTAHQEDDNIFGALKAGAHGYLLKNSSPSEILDGINEVTNGGSPMSSEIARKVVQSFRQSAIKDSDLSPREEQVLVQLAKGLLYKEIATILEISVETVRRHCFNIYRKLHVQNRTEALNKYSAK